MIEMYKILDHDPIGAFVINGRPYSKFIFVLNPLMITENKKTRMPILCPKASNNNWFTECKSVGKSVEQRKNTKTNIIPKYKPCH